MYDFKKRNYKSLNHNKPLLVYTNHEPEKFKKIKQDSWQKHSDLDSYYHLLHFTIDSMYIFSITTLACTKLIHHFVLVCTDRKKYIISRPALVAILMVPTAISFYLLLSPSKACLFASTAIIGICTGAMTSIAVSMTSDLFGPENFSVNHNIVIANIPIGSLLFGYIAALVYDEGVGREGVCIGVHCFRTTFFLWGSICSFGTILSLILYVRITRGYVSKNWFIWHESIYSLYKIKEFLTGLRHLSI